MIARHVLALVLSAGALWLVVRTWRRGFRLRAAIGVGTLTGAAIAATPAALALAPVVAVGAYVAVWRRGTVVRRYVGWLAQTAIAAAVVFAIADVAGLRP